MEKGKGVMSIAIGGISLAMSAIIFVAMFSPPINANQNVELFKVVALFLIAAAICFHG